MTDADTPQPDGVPIYRITFERVGRYSDVAPLAVAAADADELARAVDDYARPRLFSSDVAVSVDLADGRGWITLGGVQPGGGFTIERIDPAASDRPLPFMPLGQPRSAELTVLAGQVPALARLLGPSESGCPNRQPGEHPASDHVPVRDGDPIPVCGAHSEFGPCDCGQPPVGFQRVPGQRVWQDGDVIPAYVSVMPRDGSVWARGGQWANFLGPVVEVERAPADGPPVATGPAGLADVVTDPAGEVARGRPGC